VSRQPPVVPFVRRDVLASCRSLGHISLWRAYRAKGPCGGCHTSPQFDSEPANPSWSFGNVWGAQSLLSWGGSMCMDCHACRAGDTHMDQQDCRSSVHGTPCRPQLFMEIVTRAHVIARHASGKGKGPMAVISYASSEARSIPRARRRQAGFDALDVLCKVGGSSRSREQSCVFRGNEQCASAGGPHGPSCFMLELFCCLCAGRIAAGFVDSAGVCHVCRVDDSSCSCEQACVFRRGGSTFVGED
jgi:hypothetical protein